MYYLSGMKDSNLIPKRYEILSHILDERSRKIVLVTESKAIGHGGIEIVSKSTGVSRTTISTGLKELGNPKLIQPGWIWEERRWSQESH